MKKFWQAIEKDIMSEGFSVMDMMLFGIIAPGMFIMLLLLWSMIQAWACM